MLYDEEDLETSYTIYILFIHISFVFILKGTTQVYIDTKFRFSSDVYEVL